MFTGLIESVFSVLSAERAAGGMKFFLNFNQDVRCGDSIAVNGVCLTIAGLKGTMAGFDVSNETLSKTTLNKLKTGSQVNIERAVSAGGRFGGHFVQGHIDAVGKVKKIEKRGDFWQFFFELPQKTASAENIRYFLIPEGSIAVDGVSLTIADVAKNDFSVTVIPATFENTICKNYKVGDLVNVETDIICRIVKKQLEKILPVQQNLTVEKLKEMGF